VRETWLPYARQWVSEEDMVAVAEVLRSDWLTTGPKIHEFEEAVAAYVGARYAVAVSSGTAALHAACFAAGIGPGDEVITTPLTFAASANCVLYAGAEPVFADVDPVTGNVDPKDVARKVTPRTRAIIPVHLAGFTRATPQPPALSGHDGTGGLGRGAGGFQGPALLWRVKLLRPTAHTDAVSLPAAPSGMV
jgi:dTDP-4-amino-4,6-dideoxygalactose transaminase